MERHPQPAPVEKTKVVDSERRDKIIGEIDNFVKNPALVDLAGHYGLTFTDKMDTEARLIEMRQLFKSKLDFRKGSERSQSEDPNLSQEEQDKINKTAKALKMIKRVPFANKDADAGIVIMSGGRHALERTRRVAGKIHLIACGDAIFNADAIRNDQKRDQANGRESDERKEYYDSQMIALEEKYARQIPEVEFMRTAANARYGERQPDGSYQIPNTYQKEIVEKEEHVPHGEGTTRIVTHIERYTYTGDIEAYRHEQNDPGLPSQFILIQAPKRDFSMPGRVTAEDTTAALRPELPEGTKFVNISTTQLFAPFQHFAARRLLPEVDNQTTGFSTGRTSFKTPKALGQEVNSAVNEAYLLYQSLVPQS